MICKLIFLFRLVFDNKVSINDIFMTIKLYQCQ